MNDSLTIANQAPIPANSQIVPLLDSTCWNDAPPWVSTATTPGPGRSRAQFTGCRVQGTVTPTAQAMTITFEGLLNPSGTTNAAFGTDTNAPDAGVKVVAAGATYVFDYLPRFPDFRITMTAGATAPTALSTTLVLVWDRASGV
jgi:hypothetical protein